MYYKYPPILSLKVLKLHILFLYVEVYRVIKVQGLLGSNPNSKGRDFLLLEMRIDKIK